jgi:apolipoprotein N-acyltransferase
LRYARAEAPLPALLLVWLVIFVAACVAYRGVIPVPGLLYPAVLAGLALMWTLPMVADRLLYERLPGFASTLVCPLAWVTVEFAMARTSPFGTWGSVAYTQSGHLPLMQLASVTGLAGITFLVTWFGATVNWAWAHAFEWDVVRDGVLIYAIVWGVVMMAGSARLAFVRPARNVRIAAIGWPEGVLDSDVMMRAMGAHSLPDSELDALRAVLYRGHDYFLEASRREARAGARLAVWPEASLVVLQPDEAAFLQRAQQLACDENLYILVGLATIRPGSPRPLENKAVLVTPAGQLAGAYTKRYPVLGWEAAVSLPGEGGPGVCASAFGRLATPICYDMDFPSLIRPAGRAGADLLLVPASDWAIIKHLHHAQAVFRAIENGAALVRATRWGLSAAVDPLGRTLALMDDSLAGGEAAMVAYVPMAGVRTLYARLGDLFAWACAAALAGIVLVS